MNPLSPLLHPGMCQPQWDPAAFGKAFVGRTGALQPSHPADGTWEISPLAELLPGPLTAPGGLDLSLPRNCCSRAREPDPGPLGPATWLPPHKYFSSETACQLPSVSGTQWHGRSPLHCRGTRPCRIRPLSFPLPLLRPMPCTGAALPGSWQQVQPPSLRAAAGAFPLHQNTRGDC